MKFNKYLLIDGVWKKNSTVVQFLGLCPVLAVTSTAINGLSLGLTTTLVLMCTNVIISFFRKYIDKDIRIPIYMMVVSSVVTCIEMLLHAYLFNLYNTLGIFISLIVTNCIIVGQADSIAIKNTPLFSFLHGFYVGIGSTIAMLIIGSIREILGTGMLFYGTEKLFGNWSSFLCMNIMNQDHVLLLSLFPSGGFIILALISAGKRFLDNSKESHCVHKNCCKNI
ncbi:MAG TPA: electron transport complex subunit E [Buchnera sp. (in: enterobacteria)]|nr:electron transport complex subunit E [Buchnera sp. (in: enterobacteria)]